MTYAIIINECLLTYNKHRTTPIKQTKKDDNMRILTKQTSTTLGLIMLITASVFAKTQYITDELRVSIREGQGNQHKSLKVLTSGTAVTILEETETGYTKVSLEDGTEGWVRSQYLSEEPVAADRLLKTQSRLESVEKKLKTTRKQLKDLKKEQKQLKSELTTTRANLDKITSEFTDLQRIAKNPKKAHDEKLRMEEQNTQLRTDLEQIRAELDLVKQRSQIVQDRSQRNWFLAGAGVVILGMLIGLIIPKLRFQKKARWDF